MEKEHFSEGLKLQLKLKEPIKIKEVKSYSCRQYNYLNVKEWSERTCEGVDGVRRERVMEDLDDAVCMEGRWSKTRKKGSKRLGLQEEEGRAGVGPREVNKRRSEGKG